MTYHNKNVHITKDERIIIETGIKNGSTKTSIANTIGKDKSTIGKEIKAHRILKRKCSLPIECSNYSHCKFNKKCSSKCLDYIPFKCTRRDRSPLDYIPFKCTRRDRSPGACNGCDRQIHCRFDQYFYSADIAEKEYRESLSHSREGLNISEDDLKKIGKLIQPLIKQGLSPYSILKILPDINVSEKTLYN